MTACNVNDGLWPNINLSEPVLTAADTPDEEHHLECQRPQQHQRGLQGHIFSIFPRDTWRTQKSEHGATKATIGAHGTQKGTQSNSLYLLEGYQTPSTGVWLKMRFRQRRVFWHHMFFWEFGVWGLNPTKPQTTKMWYLHEIWAGGSFCFFHVWCIKKMRLGLWRIWQQISAYCSMGYIHFVSPALWPFFTKFNIKSDECQIETSLAQ